MTIRLRVRMAVAAALLVAAAGCCVSVSAHICMWSPMQRGAFAINAPGSDPCYQKPGPCGGVPYNPNGVRTTLTAGSQYTVHFQQNLNHYYVQNPGYLEVSFAQGTNPTEQQFQALGQTISDWNAMDMITQTNFSITVTIPSAPCTQCVLRTRYLSNNPLENDRGEVFHQCADVAVVAATPEQLKEQEQEREQAEERASVLRSMVLPHAERVGKEGDAPAGCCVNTQQFVMNWSETGSYRAATRGTTYYDAINKQMRVDTNSGNGRTIYDGQFVRYTNFTAGIEFYLNVVTGACEPLGPDYWNNWCYGPNNNQSETYYETVTLGTSTVNVWQNGEFFFAGTADASCTPVLLTRPDTGMMTLYYDYATGIPDPSVFVPPPQCHLALAEHLASGKPLKRSKLDLRAVMGDPKIAQH